MNACRTLNLERQSIIKPKEQEKRQLRFPITIPSSYTMSRDVKPSDTEGLENQVMLTLRLDIQEMRVFLSFYVIRQN